MIWLNLLTRISFLFCLGVISVVWPAYASADAVGDANRVEKGDSETTSSLDVEPGKRRFKTRMLRGRVVFLGEALNRRFGITVMPDAKQSILALESKNGELTPLVEDLRGRAFRTDERLRKMDIELTARQYNDLPFVQIIQVYEITQQGKFVLDYWCDICSIVMYEMGPCACCQDDNRLRKRKVDTE